MSDPVKLAFDRFYDESVKFKLKYFSLHIAGIEITQATQHFDAQSHLTDAGDRGPDNSIPLIAGKSALVRVYVRHHASDLTGVTGTLEISRPGLDGRWIPHAKPAPWGAGIVTARADPAYASERQSLGWTLNFRLPGSLLRGRMRLTATVTAPDGRSDTLSVDVAAALRQTLRIRGVAIRYQGKDNAGNDVTLARPTLADFVQTAGDALAMFPVQDEPDITLTGDFNWFAPLDGAPAADNPGGCAPTWNSLLFWLALMKTADGNRSDRIYYGLLPAGTPIGFNSGCGATGAVSAGLAGDQSAFAHECGHVLGFAHAPCNLTAGDPGDASYPAYEPYDTPTARMASIGEYGLDTRGPTVQPPATVRDFMSYCGPRWISPYHYRRLLQHPLLAPSAIYERGPRLPDWVHQEYIPERDLPRPPGPVEIETHLAWERRVRPQPLVTLTGVMRAGRLEHAEVLRLPTRRPALGTAVPGSFVELLDADGDVLERTALRRVALRGGCGCGCGGGRDCGGGAGHGGPDEPGAESGLVQAVLPEREGITAMRVVRDGQPLWRREAGDAALQVGALEAAIDAVQLSACWHLVRPSTHEAGHLHLMLRAAAELGPDASGTGRDDDRDIDWQVVWSWSGPADEAQSCAVVPLESLPTGCLLLQLLACDGFHTAISESVPFELPPRPPTAVILQPEDGGAVRCGELVRLKGMAVAADGSVVPDEALEWELDGRRVGRGRELEGELGPWEGEHRVALRVRDRHGEAVAEAVFAATCSGLAPVRLRRT